MNCFRLIKVFIRKSFQQEMAFRFNFFTNIINTILNLAGGLIGLTVLFEQVQRLNGWGFAEVLALLGVYLLVQSLKDLVIGPSLESISGMGGELWIGTFDYTILKPIPAQFYISFRNWRPWAFIDVTVSVIILIIAIVKLSVNLNLFMIILFVISLIVSLLILYSLMLILISAAFWYLGVPLTWIYDSLIQMGRFPVRIYPNSIRLLLTWVIPIGFIITIPAEALIGKVELTGIIGGCVLAVGLFLTASAFFRTSLKRYSSASS